MTLPEIVAALLIPLALLGTLGDTVLSRFGSWGPLRDLVWFAVMVSALVGFVLLVTNTVTHAGPMGILGLVLYAAFFYWFAMGAWRRTSMGCRRLQRSEPNDEPWNGSSLRP